MIHQREMLCMRSSHTQLALRCIDTSVQFLHKIVDQFFAVQIRFGLPCVGGRRIVFPTYEKLAWLIFAEIYVQYFCDFPLCFVVRGWLLVIGLLVDFDFFRCRLIWRIRLLLLFLALANLWRQWQVVGMLFAIFRNQCGTVNASLILPGIVLGAISLPTDQVILAAGVITMINYCFHLWILMLCFKKG